LPTFTLATLEGYVWDKLDQNVGLYPELQVRLAINQGLRRLSLITGLFQATVPVPGWTVANQLVYNTPPGILIPITVYVEERELVKAGSLQELAEQHRNWAVDTTATSGPTQRWAAIGITQFVIHPMDAVGGRLLEVSGVAPIIPLVNPGDVVNLDDEWVDMLVDYASTRVMIREIGKPFSGTMGIQKALVEKLKTLTIWQGDIFPEYWFTKALEGSRGRGA
jgi:hypothetical protein